MTDEQVKAFRTMVWVDGVPYREAARRLGIKTIGGGVWRALHGFAYKTAGGPTSRGEKE